MPWMSLDGGPDGPDALAFSDSGRLLFIGVHDDTVALDGGPSDGILRYDTQTGDLTLFARLEIFGSGTTWPHNALAYYKGVLYAGVQGSVQAFRATMNDRTGTLLFSSAAPAGAMVHGLAVDRANGLLYATWNAGGSDQIYRSPITGFSLSFTLVGGGLQNLRAVAYSDSLWQGGDARALCAGIDDFAGVRAGLVYQPEHGAGAAVVQPDGVPRSLRQRSGTTCARTADGKLLAGADEDAVLAISDGMTRTRGFHLTRGSRMRIYFALEWWRLGAGLIARPDPGELSGMVIDADTVQGTARFHPATPDGACWTVLLLLMNAAK